MEQVEFSKALIKLGYQLKKEHQKALLIDTILFFSIFILIKKKRF